MTQEDRTSDAWPPAWMVGAAAGGLGLIASTRGWEGWPTVLLWTGLLAAAVAVGLGVWQGLRWLGGARFLEGQRVFLFRLVLAWLAAAGLLALARLV